MQQQAGAVFKKWAVIFKTAAAVAPGPAPPKAYHENKFPEKKRPRPEDTAAKAELKIAVEAALSPRVALVQLASDLAAAVAEPGSSPGANRICGLSRINAI